MTESLYRKYRPQTFADVVGQDAIERTLRNALSQNKVSHAYLFCGPRGTGKTTTARLMAKALLCEKGVTPDPDGTCEACRMIAEGRHPDVYELDAASRTGVDNVREEIIGRVNFAPTIGRAKVYIIDEVHMLSIAAFNALLKTLEEPPEHVVFILCTTDPNKVPPTIHSRCQRFDFHRISVDQIVARLGAVCVEEDVEFEPEALELIAERSDGGMRNALTSLEQLIVFSEGKVTKSAAEDLLGSLDSSDMAEIVEAIGHRDAAACFAWMAKYVETGADLAQFARDLAEHFRALYLIGLIGDDAPLEINDAERAQLMRELPYFSTDRLARLLMILGDLMNELRTSTNPRLSFEISLTRMVHPSADLTLESLAERIETLEKAISARPMAAAAPASAPIRDAAVVPPTETQPSPAAEQHAQAAPSAPMPASAANAPQPTAASAAAARARAAAQAAAARAKAHMAAQQAAHPASAPQPQPAPQAPVPVDVPEDDYDMVPDDYLPAEAYEDGAQPASVSTGQPAGPTMPAPSPAAVAPKETATKPAVAPAASSEPVPATQAAPATAPTAPKEPTDASVPEALSNPAALQRGWQATMAALKKEKAAFGILFMNTQVSAKEDTGSILVTFPHTNKFAYASVKKPEVYEALERATEKGFGSVVKVEFAQEGADASPQSTSMYSDVSAATVESRPIPSPPTSPAGSYASRPAPTRPASAPGTAPRPMPAPAQQPAPAQPAPQTVPAQPAPADPSDDSQPASTKPAVDGEAGDLASMLAAGFGAGVVFEEVDASAESEDSDNQADGQ